MIYDKRMFFTNMMVDNLMSKSVEERLAAMDQLHPDQRKLVLLLVNAKRMSA